MTLSVGSFLGPYQVVAQLGAGGMGEIYQAQDPRLHRDVAIKVLQDRPSLSRDVLDRFQRENMAIAALSHPNIRSIFDVGSYGDRTFAVMELLTGETLAARIQRSSIPWGEAAPIALAIAEGLAAAHGKRIIHRDIKPKNIFLTNDGGVKILDFGLARLATREADDGREARCDDSTLATKPGAVLGTAPYMSPEQVRGEPADARSDIFSFGSVVYEMLTGTRAFQSDTIVETMNAVLKDDPPPLADRGAKVPYELHRIIAHCLEKKPGRRFQSAVDLSFALQGLDGARYENGSAESMIGESTSHTGSTSHGSLGAEPSIAVLPFVNMSADPNNEFFSDGLAEELINAMCKITGLQVASRTSAFAFKGKDLDIRDIGHKLGVGAILEGSVRRVGDRLRINAQFINVADGYHLWSETFDRELDDVFAIQDQIAQAIARSLKVVLSDQEKSALAKVPTANIEAYEYFLRGRQLFHLFRHVALERARELFLKACKIDPHYAAAYAGLAKCCGILHSYWGASEAYLIEADDASRKAIELDPELSQAHVARGLAFSLRSKFDEAREEFEAAIRLDPDSYDAYYIYARSCFAHGDLDKAVELFEQASRVNPEDYEAICLAATVYSGLGKASECEAAGRRSLVNIKRHLELYPQDGRALYMGAIVQVHLGDHVRSLEWAERACAADPGEPLVLYNVACTYALLGKTDESMDCIERAIGLGGSWREWMANDPDLSSLHGHPRFQKLLEKV